MANSNPIGKFLLLGALVFGCAHPSVAPAPVSAPKYDAKTIFRAVYFNDGPAVATVDSWKLPRRDAAAASTKTAQPAVLAEQMRDLADNYDKAGMTDTATNMRAVADKIAATKALTPTQTANQRTAAMNLILTQIGKQDKTFFDRFGKSIRSGSHTKVASTLQDGIAHITAAATASAAKSTATTATMTLTTSTTGSVSTQSLKILDGDDDDGSGGGGDFGGDDGSGGGDFGGGDPNSGGGDLSGDGSQFPDNGGGADPNTDGTNPSGGGADPNTDGTNPSSGGTDPNSSSSSSSSGSADGTQNPDASNQQASLWINQSVALDTAVAVVNVVFHLNTIATSQNPGDNSGLGTASLVAHLTDTFAE